MMIEHLDPDPQPEPRVEFGAVHEHDGKLVLCLIIGGSAVEYAIGRLELARLIGRAAEKLAAPVQP